MKDAVYTDDNLITDLIASKRSLDEVLRVSVSVPFAGALATGADFVHVVVDQPVQIEVLA
jgi:hypothetical protein